jgi:hypothetical protein
LPQRTTIAIAGVYHAAVEELIQALETFNWPEAERICAGIIDDASVAPYPERSATRILKALRRKRQFALMSLVADAFIRGGLITPEIFRQYAQSMIDQGNFTASRMVLHSIVDNPEAPDSEKAEARGLLGRIYKQLYVWYPRQEGYLRKAIQLYYDVYKVNPKSFLWQGINTVALLARASRDKVPPPDLPPVLDIAREIDAILGNLEPLEYWDRATALEVAVALDDTDTAFAHALQYAGDKKADAFEIASLLRQLKEVWQLTTDRAPGNLLLPILEAALLKRQGGCLTVEPERVASDADNAAAVEARLEKVFGKQKYQSLNWYKTGLKRCEAVGRVETLMDRGVGSGFLVRASDFFSGASDKELLFLTNAHVVPEEISFKKAKVVFEANGQSYRVVEQLWSSPSNKLDATFLRLEGISDQSELCPLVPDPEPYDVDKRVYVIGYPLGGKLSFSLQDSHWLSNEGDVLLYRTPTEPGSSGSPVFDQDYWTLIGLHHAARQTANEAVKISAIQKATRAATKAAVVPDPGPHP